MKVIVVDGVGNEKLVCESVDTFHGLMIVKLLNGNFASKLHKRNYKLVEMEYIMNEVPFDDGVEQLTIDGLVDNENDVW